MATSLTEDSFEEHIKNLLECPVCTEPIKSAPIYQCTNGHIICKRCICKLENCPICRSELPISRSLPLEQIIEKFSKFQLTNENSIEESKNQELGQELNSGPIEEVNLPPNTENSDTISIPEWNYGRDASCQYCIDKFCLAFFCIFVITSICIIVWSLTSDF